MVEPAQLALFCRGCCGSGVVVVDAPNHDGDLVPAPAPCPTCRPSPALAETWRAVATLGRRLARRASAGELDPDGRRITGKPDAS